MPTNHGSSMLQFLRRLVASPSVTTDTELLHRFAHQQDEAAFTALLHRHGPMVLGVCQRVLGNRHDAEDAFQATFLVFARKACSVAKPASLGSWLYGVAYRTAVKARAGIAKRRAKETQVVSMLTEETPPDIVWADLGPVLDAEVNGLPDRYRVAFVLCYLQGKTNQEAATFLGCPKGTMLSRLATARERLRSRLTRRGVVLSTGLLAAALSEGAASAAVPPLLIASTAKAALGVAAGQQLVGLVSETVIALTEGMVRAMLLSKLKVAAATLLALIVFAFGAGAVTRLVSAAEEPERAKAAEPKVPSQAKLKEPPKDDPKEMITTFKDGDAVLERVDTEKATITLVTGINEAVDKESPKKQQEILQRKVETEGKTRKLTRLVDLRVAKDADMKLVFRHAASIANSKQMTFTELAKCNWLYASVELVGEGDQRLVRKIVVWR